MPVGQDRPAFDEKQYSFSKNLGYVTLIDQWQFAESNSEHDLDFLPDKLGQQTVFLLRNTDRNHSTFRTC
jgi:hypothetical protein